MDTKIETTTTTKPAKAPRQIKTPGAKAVKAKPNKVAVEAKQAAAPKVNAHVAAGVAVSDYSGLSSMINNNRKAEVKLVSERDPGKLTERMQKSVYALRRVYGTKAFGVKGFDNGIIRDLLAAKMIRLSGGQETVIDGSPYMIDGATPLTATFTAAGTKYGTV